MARKKMETRSAGEPLAATTGSATTLALDAYRSLRTDIITARLAPGKKLKIREIGDGLGIGLSPVREALNRLSSEGLVVQNAQRGFTVAGFSIDDLEEMTNAKCWLNEVGLRQSILKADSSWEEEVLVAYHRLSKTPRYLGDERCEPNRNPAWDEVHRSFHVSLVSGCGSHWLIGFCKTMFDASDRYRALARLKSQRATHLDEHRGIMEAAVNRDADKAVELLTLHFRRTEELVRANLQNEGRSAEGTFCQAYASSRI